MADIILGSDAISRPSSSPAGYTYIYLARPAPGTGYITSFEVYFHTAPGQLKIGVFYHDGSNWRCRNSITVEGLGSGLNVIGGIYMPCESTDYVGWWHNSGTIARHDSGGSGAYYISGEYADPGDILPSVSLSSGRIISVKAIGATDVTPPATLDSLTEDITDDFNPVFQGLPQPIFTYTLNASPTESEVTLTATRPGATILYSYGSVVDKSVPSGTGETIPLAYGDNVVSIKVQEAGYTDSEYTITVTRIEPVDWEYIRPSADTATKSLKIYPASPSTHYDKVLDPEWLKRVYWDMGTEVGDLWQFRNPIQREIAEVKKIRIHAVGYRNNPLAWGKFAVYTNGGLYKGSQKTWGGYQAIPRSEYHTLKLNPITSAAWTLSEIDALLAGEYHFDSGIPSGVGTAYYFISVIYVNASVRTNTATNYTGTGATLNGMVTNTEGAYLDPYLASSSAIRVRFQWGETTAYGNYTSYEYGVTGAFSANIAGLDPAKTYHFRAIVEVFAGGNGTQGGWDVYYGADMEIGLPGGGKNIANDLVREVFI